VSTPGRTPGVGPGFVLVLALIVAVGLALRLGDWRAVEAAGGRLGPDAREYLTIARQMKGFYWPSYREPLHPALIRMATWVVGPSERAPRLVSFTFSNLLVLVTALVGWRLFGSKTSPTGGRWPALAASAFVAVHPYYLFRSTEGLRIELYSVLLLVFVWLLSDERVARPALRLVLAGAVGGLLSLLRMTSFIFILPALTWCVLARAKGSSLRSRSLAGLTAVMIMVLMVTPYLYVCHRYLGDSLIWINRHADWWYHRELADAQRRGRLQTPPRPMTPGPEAGGESGVAGLATGPARTSPTIQRIRRTGRRMTVWQYVVGDRSLGAVVVRMLKGYGEMFWILGSIFATEGLYGKTHLVALVGWLGFVGLARSLWQGPRLPVVVVLLSLLPVSFVASVGANFRLFLHVLPLWILWLAWGLAWPWALLSSRRPSIHPSA